MSISVGLIFSSHVKVSCAVVFSFIMLMPNGVQAQASLFSTTTGSDVCNTERTSNVTFVHARWQFGEIRNNSPEDKIPVSCPISAVYLADYYEIGYVVHNSGEETQTISCTLTEWAPNGRKDQVLSRSVKVAGGFVDVLYFEDVTMVDPLNMLHARCVLPPETSLKHHFVDNYFF